MSNEQQSKDQEQAKAGLQQADQSGQFQQSASQQSAQGDKHPDFDALANKKPDELTPEELRLMADTMPGEGPGD